MVLRRLIFIVLFCLLPTLSFGAQGGNPGTQSNKVTTDTTNFNNNLSTSDTDIQKALDTIDNLTITDAPTNATYLTSTSNVTLTNEVDLGLLSSGFLYGTVAGGTSTISSVDTATVTNGATTLSTGDQIYDFVIGQGYLTAEVDGSTSNEINTITLPDANVTAGLGITFAQSGAIAITESVADTVLFTVTEVDGSITNELPIAGNLIDISGSPASTVDVDLTEAESVTWGAGGNASNIWTFNLSGTDWTMTIGSALATFSAGVTISGTTTIGTLAGAIDAGGATSLEIPNAANPTLATTGMIAINTTDKTLELNNGTAQVAFPTIHIAQGTFDLKSQYAVDPDLWLIDLNADSYPHGIYITAVYVDANVADPTTELNANLNYCDATTAAFPGANPTLIKAIDTTTGNFADAAVNTAIPTGKSLYITMDADPTDANTQYHIRIHYYIPTS